MDNKREKQKKNKFTIFKSGIQTQDIKRSWKIVKSSIEKSKKVMKKQFNKKKQNSQRLKQKNNAWLEVKKYLVKMTLKEVGLKYHRPFNITKEIRQGVFQLELLEEQTIYNI